MWLSKKPWYSTGCFTTALRLHCSCPFVFSPPGVSVQRQRALRAIWNFTRFRDNFESTRPWGILQWTVLRKQEEELDCWYGPLLVKMSLTPRFMPISHWHLVQYLLCSETSFQMNSFRLKSHKNYCVTDHMTCMCQLSNLAKLARTRSSSKCKQNRHQVLNPECKQKSIRCTWTPTV